MTIYGKMSTPLPIPQPYLHNVYFEAVPEGNDPRFLSML